MRLQDLRSSSNLLIRHMEAGDAARLAPHFARVCAAKTEVLTRADTMIKDHFFIEDGITSVVSSRLLATRVEIAVIGREGMTGTAALLMADQSPHDSFVQVGPVVALRIAHEIVHDAMAQSAPLRALLLRYVQTLLVQATNNAIANVSDRLDARLARWLLMCHDRVDGDGIALTHEFMAMMIGGQRSAVTSALHELEGHHFILSQRGVVRIRDREGLEAVAGDGYGLPEAEYRRLIGPFGKVPSDLASLSNSVREPTSLSRTRQKAAAS